MSAASRTARFILDTTGHAYLPLPAPDAYKRRALALPRRAMRVGG